MYILIDTDKMDVLAKHPNFQVLCELGIILCSEAQAVLPVETWAVDSSFTDVELQRLYINMTGNQEGAVYVRTTITRILCSYFNEVPETILSAHEVSKQCDYVLERDLQGACSFNPGTLVPCTDGSNPWKPFRIEASQSTELDVASGKEIQYAEAQQSEFTVVQERASVTTSTNADHIAVPRDGSVREVIWQRADELWEQAGKPTDKPDVLKLRRNIMATLESEGIKKTSSSTELGKWHATRAPF